MKRPIIALILFYVVMAALTSDVDARCGGRRGERVGLFHRLRERREERRGGYESAEVREAAPVEKLPAPAKKSKCNCDCGCAKTGHCTCGS